MRVRTDSALASLFSLFEKKRVGVDLNFNGGEGRGIAEHPNIVRSPLKSCNSRFAADMVWTRTAAVAATENMIRPEPRGQHIVAGMNANDDLKSERKGEREGELFTPLPSKDPPKQQRKPQCEERSEYLVRELSIAYVIEIWTWRCLVDVRFLGGSYVKGLPYINRGT